MRESHSTNDLIADSSPALRCPQCRCSSCEEGLTGYLNNIIEQDHRHIKRLTRPMLNFKNFHAAQRTLAGIEVMAMIKKGQMKTRVGDKPSPAEQFYALTA